MKTCNVGILGYGFIGKVHTLAYASLPFYYDPVPLKARITHVCTSRPESSAAAAQSVGADVGTTDFRRVTEDPNVDIVHVCTPNHLHADALLSAMHHGKHIYCDKPLVARLDEADRVRDALGDYRATAQMTLQNRFFPAMLRARELVEEGRLGPILQYRAVYLHAGSADPEAPLKWKLSGAAGGGVIADLAPHPMDLVHHLVGDFDSILAETKIAYPQRPDAADPSRRVTVDAEDCVVMLAKMACGAIGTIEASKIATGNEDGLRLEINGQRGALRFSLMDPHHLEFFDATRPGDPHGGRRGWTRIAAGQRCTPPATSFPSPKAATGWIRAHISCLGNFLECVADGRPAQPGLEQGLYIQRLMHTARTSAREGRWTPVGD